MNEKLINVKIAYEELKEKNQKKDIFEKATILFKKSIKDIEINIETYNQEKNDFYNSLKKILNKKKQ